MKVIITILLTVMLLTVIWATVYSSETGKQYRPLSLSELLEEFSNTEFEILNINELVEQLEVLYDERPDYDNKLFEMVDNIATLPVAIAHVLRFVFLWVNCLIRNILTVLKLLSKMLILTPV